MILPALCLLAFLWLAAIMNYNSTSKSGRTLFVSPAKDNINNNVMLSKASFSYLTETLLSLPKRVAKKLKLSPKRAIKKLKLLPKIAKKLKLLPLVAVKKMKLFQ